MNEGSQISPYTPDALTLFIHIIQKIKRIL